jgi:hypothetical protein
LSKKSKNKEQRPLAARAGVAVEEQQPHQQGSRVLATAKDLPPHKYYYLKEVIIFPKSLTRNAAGGDKKML